MLRLTRFITILFLTVFIFLPKNIYAATYDLTNQSNYNLRLDGNASGYVGYRTSGFADVNNNGIDDFYVSSSYYIYVVYDDVLQRMMSEGKNFNMFAAGNYSVRIGPIVYGSAAKFADFDNDGKVDFVGNAYNDSELFIINNSVLTTATGTITVNDANNYSYAIETGATMPNSAFDFDHIGDFNGDGKADLAIPNCYADYGGNNTGSMYVLDNSLISASTKGNLINLTVPGSYTIRFDGEKNDPQFGCGIISPEFLDIDNNGKDELIIGSPFHQSGLSAAYIISDQRLNSIAPGSNIDLANSDTYSIKISIPINVARTLRLGDFDNSGYESIRIGKQIIKGDYLAGLLGSSNHVIDTGVEGIFLNITNADSFGHATDADFDFDGQRDFLFYDLSNDENGNNKGKATLFNSEIIKNLSGFNNSLSFVDPALNKLSFLGDSSPTACCIIQNGYAEGDVNGDQRPDFIFASDWTAYNGSRSGSAWVILNFPHQINLTGLPSLMTSGSFKVEGNIAADLSISNISGVQYSIGDNAFGANWQDCTPTDGLFDSKTESFACAISSLSNGSHTIYVRAYDENRLYTNPVSYGSVQANINQSEVVESIPDPNIIPGWAEKIMAGPGYVGTPNFISNEHPAAEKLVNVFIDRDTHRDDLYVEFEDFGWINILAFWNNPDEVKLPWSQGLNAVSEIQKIEAKAAFNGYPVAETDKPYIILLGFDKEKLGKLDQKQLKIAHFNEETKKWETINNSYVYPDGKVATTTNKFGYFSVVYPRSVWGQR